ncbi:MAG: sulfatase-like hydrolase/transferase [Planctomycetota bacterium]
MVNGLLLKIYGTLVLIGLVMGNFTMCAAAAPGQSPNIIIIISDDQGYADLSIHGCKDFRTPHLDALAAGGVRCSNAYVTAPVCSPSRAGLLSGRGQQRFGHYLNVGGDAGLPVAVKTIGDRMKNLGYTTGAFGKWHLGYRDQFYPTHRGFDYFYGFRGGSHGYFGGKMERNGTRVDEKEYLTDAIARETIAFIRDKKDQPFLIYCAFNAPHTPLQAKKEDLKKHAGIKDGNRRTYAAMITNMDDNIGKIIAAVRDEGLEENTLIFFLSDNGGMPSRYSDNSPLRGSKGTTWEGGVRVPFLVSWKGVLPAGKVHDDIVSTLDILPTSILAGGGQIDPAWKLEGVNLLPLLKGPAKSGSERTLFWHWHPDRLGIRKGSKKVVWMPSKESKESKPGLYDLDADIAESKDLSETQKDILDDLIKTYETWDKDNIDPLWGSYGKKIEPKAKSK